MDHVAINLAGLLRITKSGNVYILVIINVCTQFVMLCPIPFKTAAEVDKF